VIFLTQSRFEVNEFLAFIIDKMIKKIIKNRNIETFARGEYGSST